MPDYEETRGMADLGWGHAGGAAGFYWVKLASPGNPDGIRSRAGSVRPGNRPGQNMSFQPMTVYGRPPEQVDTDRFKTVQDLHLVHGDAWPRTWISLADTQ
jgi:hypothetical protein